MSGHKVACCFFGLCCPPLQQQETIANMIEEAGSPEAAAAAILAMADLVPKGVVDALFSGYKGMFKDEVVAGRGGYGSVSAGAPGGRAADDEAKGTPDESA